MSKVLIVGAGPTGMMLAAQLAQRDVPVRIVDRRDGPSSTSRAFTVHARTLELLELMGLADDFVERGIKTLSMDYHFPGKADTPQLDFTAIDSRYPYCLTISQVDTEAMLRHYLEGVGVSIEWNIELVGLSQDADAVTAELRVGDEVQTARTPWLVGCDGWASTVRGQLDLPFDGSDYAGTMRMVDAPLDGFPDSDDAIHYYVAKDHMLLVNKLPGDNYRVLISDKTEGVPPEQAREAFQQTLEGHFGDAVALGEPEWATNFRISRRKANAYREDRVFLAGDAAHVNSPAGGQGMNVAIQDAVNLGWKLAMVAHGCAPASLLDTYEAERAPVAEQMLEGTSYIHSIIMAHGKGMTERIALMQGGAWNRKAVNQVSGVSYTYRDGESGADLQPGDRVPDVDLGGTRLYEAVNDRGLSLLSLDPSTHEPAAAHLQEHFGTSVTAHPVDPESDAGQILCERLASGDALLVRPDGHLAWCGDTADLDGLVEAAGAVLKRGG